MITEGMLIKLAGAIAGTVLALVFIPPRTLAGFFRRTTASLICGPIFAPVLHGYLVWPNAWEHWLAAAALTSFLSWWLLGVIVSAAKKWLGEKALPD
jgi:hypothetical protein